MEYESSPERLPTNPASRVTGKKIDKKKRKAVVDMLKDGTGTSSITEATGVSKCTVIAIKKDIEDNKGFELGSWKKQTSALLSQIVSKGSERLLEEIQNDKVLSLQEAPTVVVEHRLRVSHEDINKMIKGDVIDVTPKLEEKP
jgi:hypothetical protein